MTVRIPAGLRPVASGSPKRGPVALIHAEKRDIVVNRSDLPRSYGSQFAGWQGGAR